MKKTLVLILTMGVLSMSCSDDTISHVKKLKTEDSIVGMLTRGNQFSCPSSRDDLDQEISEYFSRTLKPNIPFVESFSDLEEAKKQ